MLASVIARLLGVITVRMLFSFFKMILGWLDRRLAAPVMHERINTASEKFFVEEEKHWGESEIDNLG